MNPTLTIDWSRKLRRLADALFLPFCKAARINFQAPWNEFSRTAC